MPNDNQSIERVAGSSSLTDILIQVEDFIDSLDLYVFKNWFDGEIVDGPNVNRYWVTVTLQYDYKDMPDPKGGMRLVSRGCKVYFWKAKQEVATPIESPSDYRDDGRHSKPAMENKDIWLVEIHIPRRFINDVDATDISAAENAGIDDQLVAAAHEEDIDVAAEFEKNEAEPADDEEGKE